MSLNRLWLIRGSVLNAVCMVDAKGLAAGARTEGTGVPVKLSATVRTVLATALNAEVTGLPAVLVTVLVRFLANPVTRAGTGVPVLLVTCVLLRRLLVGDTTLGKKPTGLATLGAVVSNPPLTKGEACMVDDVTNPAMGV